MKKFLMLLSAVFSLALSAAEVKWQNDMASASEAAKKEKKPIIMLFTGSDWCPPCMKMERTTWKDAKVVEYVNKNYIPLLVDLPRGKQLPAEQVQKNQALSAKYKLRYVPTIVVTDADGKELGRTGFNTPDSFLKFLKKY